MPHTDVPHFPQGKRAYFKKLFSFKFYRSPDISSPDTKLKDAGKSELSTGRRTLPAALGDDISNLVPDHGEATDSIQSEYANASRAIGAPTMPVNSGGPDPREALPDGSHRSMSNASVNRKRDRTTQLTTSGAFHQARDFEINEPTFNDIHVDRFIHQVFNTPSSDHRFMAQLKQMMEIGGPGTLQSNGLSHSLHQIVLVLLSLKAHKVSGAEIYSEERSDPPRCHPKTRVALRDMLISWLVREAWQLQNFVWLAGPAGAGKSAVAQTFAEYCLEQRRLGAAFFFSRLHKRGQINGLIATIAYQLAVRYAEYKRIITDIIADNPDIFDKTLRVQFHENILKPFSDLAALSVFSAQNVPVIIIDGLDECEIEDRQKELVHRVIVEFVNLTKEPFCPLLWLVCSRPESHIKDAFLRARPPFMYRLQEITCDTDLDKQDVYLILEDGLRQVHKDASSGSSADQEWPEKSKLKMLAHRVGGLPVLASTVVRYIGGGGDEPDDSPDRLLDECLSVLEGSNKLITRNPLEALDTLYIHIMSLIQHSCLFAAKQLISFCIMISTEEWENKIHTALDVALYLELSEYAFYNVLKRLHSVLEIPPVEEAHKQPLRFFHKSFGDFFQDLSRSKKFGMDIHQARYEVARLSIPHHNHIIQANCKLDRESHYSPFSP